MTYSGDAGARGAGGGGRRRGPDEQREQLPSAGHAVPLVQLLHVSMNGVTAAAEAGGNLLFAVAGEETVERLPHPRGQPRRRDARPVSVNASAPPPVAVVGQGRSQRCLRAAVG